MKKQRPEPVIIKPLRPARELAAMMTKLPKEERFKVEGILLGLEIAHRPEDVPPGNHLA